MHIKRADALNSLHALSAGSAVPLEEFGGRVHSVFERACNLRLDDGTLVTLLHADYGNVPQGIRLRVPPNFSFEDIGLQTGQEAVAVSSVLSIEEVGLQIDLTTASVWHCDLPELRVNLGQDEVYEAWHIGLRQLYEKGIEGDLSALKWSSDRTGHALTMMDGASPVASIAYPAVSHLLRLTRSCRHAELESVLEPLIGLGSGLTPSCDDFLVGYLGGLWSTVSIFAGQGRDFLQKLGIALESLTQLTNEISRSYLLHAAQGRVSELLAVLAQAIGTGRDENSIRKATQKALNVGSTSGADGVLGLIIGLSIWQSTREN